MTVVLAVKMALSAIFVGQAHYWTSGDLGREFAASRSTGCNNCELKADVRSRAVGVTMPKFADYHRTVVGYHGTKRSVALRIVSGEASILRSENEYDWLGNGVYYWEYAPKQAWNWAERQRRNGKWEKHEEIAVVASMIRLGFCFDLLDPDNIRELVKCYDDYLKLCKTLGQPPRRNAQHKKYLDCAIFQLAYKVFDLKGTPVDSARAVYVPTKSEGRVWKSSWIHQDSHIQLCVRNDDCILGSWLAKTL